MSRIDQTRVPGTREVNMTATAGRSRSRPGLDSVASEAADTRGRPHLWAALRDDVAAIGNRLVTMHAGALDDTKTFMKLRCQLSLWRFDCM